MKRIPAYIGYTFFFSLVATAADFKGPERFATPDELAVLFQLVNPTPPPKSHLLADITSTETPELTGLRVEEWSGQGKFRRDTAAASKELHKYFDQPVVTRESILVIPNPTNATPTTFRIQHDTKTVTIRAEAYPRQSDLSLCATLHDQAGAPFHSAMLDLKTVIRGPQGIPDRTRWKPDATKIDSLACGKNPRAKIRATDGVFEGRAATVFTIDTELYDIEDSKPVPEKNRVAAKATLVDFAGQNVVVECAYTNLDLHTSYQSKCWTFTANGFPKFWETTSIDKQGGKNTRNVIFREIADRETFEEKAVFSTNFPIGYQYNGISVAN